MAKREENREKSETFVIPTWRSVEARRKVRSRRQ